MVKDERDEGRPRPDTADTVGEGAGVTQPDLFEPNYSTESQLVTESPADPRPEDRALFEQVAERILTLCEARGLPPIELVRTARLDYSHVRGPSGHGLFERDFSLSALHRIATALGVPVQALFEASRKDVSPEVKEAPVYRQHRIHSLQLLSGLWVASTVNFGTRKMTNKDSLTDAVTHIPGEYDSEERAIQAARDYLDQQTEHGPES